MLNISYKSFVAPERVTALVKWGDLQHTCYTVLFFNFKNYIQYAQWPEEWQSLSTTQVVNIIKCNEEYFSPGIKKKKNHTMDFSI